MLNVPYFSNIPANNTMNAAFDKYFPGMKEEPGLQRGKRLAVGLRLAVRGGGQRGGLGANGSTPTSAELIKGLESEPGR